MNLYLFTTAGCHLCEKAKAVIWSVPSEFNLKIIAVEIADNDQWIERYGIKIPVVSKAESPEFSSAEHELCWPFSKEDLLVFVQTR